MVNRERLYLYNDATFILLESKDDMYCARTKNEFAHPEKNTPTWWEWVDYSETLSKDLIRW